MNVIDRLAAIRAQMRSLRREANILRTLITSGVVEPNSANYEVKLGNIVRLRPKEQPQTPQPPPESK